jgi:hypothetical protein
MTLCVPSQNGFTADRGTVRVAQLEIATQQQRPVRIGCHGHVSAFVTSHVAAYTPDLTF